MRGPDADEDLAPWTDDGFQNTGHRRRGGGPPSPNAPTRRMTASLPGSADRARRGSPAPSQYRHPPVSSHSASRRWRLRYRRTGRPSLASSCALGPPRCRRSAPRRPEVQHVKTSDLNAATATTMKRPIGTILANVAMVLIVVACLMPRSTIKCTVHSRIDAETMAVGVVPSPKTGKNRPSVALIRIRQAVSARQARTSSPRPRQSLDNCRRSPPWHRHRRRRRVRLAPCQALEHEGKHQHADAGDGPGDQRAKAARGASKGRWQREDALLRPSTLRPGR